MTKATFFLQHLRKIDRSTYTYEMTCAVVGDCREKLQSRKRDYGNARSREKNAHFPLDMDCSGQMLDIISFINLDYGTIQPAGRLRNLTAIADLEA